ncbi:hypothetical protein OHB12_08760 [Nocardia sp. NBC_01730]|uniref:hypothetical protein n=1 Tax=Nocardia sp. NBC_01730 TaxID=2975998 RepID=UPI002E0E95F0|nr:hypothetical protein OHB12_08760 [Nocardia sp. NBC_01730]
MGTQQLYLVGSHASQAMSPTLWTRVFQRSGLDIRYDAWDVPEATGLAEVERRLRAGEVSAVNITMPHKAWAFDIADQADDDATAAGVANLLIATNGRLRAMNTDMTAVRMATEDRTFRRVLLLGAGGAGHAFAFALRGRIAVLDIADADADAAVTLARELDERVGVTGAVEWAARVDQLADYDLVVNATPLGRSGKFDVLPWGTAELSQTTRVYDFVYSDTPNSVARYAAAHGTRLINGWAHLYLQAVGMLAPLSLPQPLAGLLRESVTELGGAISTWDPDDCLLAPTHPAVM